MSRRKNTQYPWLKPALIEYTNDRNLDLEIYSEYHMRVMDGGFTTIDLWTTGRYYVLHTDYSAQMPKAEIPGGVLSIDMNDPERLKKHKLDVSGRPRFLERGGEKGMLPLEVEPELYDWLDKLFYAVDMAEEQS
jgi:hypothetical protein